MVRLNKSHLQQKQIDQLFNQLAIIIAPKEPDRTAAALGELLGKEERIMLAKRIAVIVLLSEGFSGYKIAEELKLSKSTIATISEKLSAGKFNKIEKLLAKDSQKYHSILEVIDNILHLGGTLPHYNGLDRYKNI